jgi:hypothetical protein
VDFTSFIQTTATLGLFGALIVVIVTRTNLGEGCVQGLGMAHTIFRFPSFSPRRFPVDSHAAFESPVFVKMKNMGTTSRERRWLKRSGVGHEDRADPACSARSWARRWCGTQGSFMPCSFSSER